MSRSLFNKRDAASKGDRRKRRPSATSGYTSEPHAKQAAAEQTDPRSSVAIDDSLVALSRELSALNAMQVPPGAKERGWAALQRELERKPVRATIGTKGSAGRSRAARRGSFRWALGGAAAAIAVIATLVATLGGGVMQTAQNDVPTTVPTVVSTDTSVPDTTVSSTPITTQGSSSTAVTQPDTTQTTTDTSTTGSSTGTSTGVSTTVRPTTTQPPATQPTSTSTTVDQQHAAQQRIASAEEAAAYLAQLVISGNTSGMTSVVASSAQSGLAHMVRSLNQPYDYAITAGVMESSFVVRVSLDINDRVVDGQGEVVETVEHFFIKVEVESDLARIIAINGGS